MPRMSDRKARAGSLLSDTKTNRRLYRRSTFETTVITVRILRPTDPVPTPESFNQSFQTSQTALEPGISRPRQPGLITYGSRKVNGIRQSKRIRQVNGHDKKAKVTINREMTVKALKIEVRIPSSFDSFLVTHPRRSFRRS